MFDVLEVAVVAVFMVVVGGCSKTDKCPLHVMVMNSVI